MIPGDRETDASLLKTMVELAKIYQGALQAILKSEKLLPAQCIAALALESSKEIAREGLQDIGIWLS